MNVSSSSAWRLLVDGTHLGPEAKGVGLYTQNVLQHLLAMDPRLHLDIVVLEGLEKVDLPVDLEVADRVRWQAVPWKNHLWHGLRTLPRAVHRLRPQGVWMPYETPIAAVPVPFAMICHDIPSALRQAQAMGGGDGGGWRHWLRRFGLHPLDEWLLGRTLRRANWLFSNSQWVADGLADAHRLDRSRQRLAPCAPAVDFEALCREVDRDAVRRRLELPEGYVLTFDTGDPRENQRVVPQVMGRLMDRLPVGLVVAGVRPSHRAQVEARYAGLPWRSRVRLQPFLGADQRRQLAELYAGASVYFDPSLQEGFGMQVVEAMACGTPVVCSNTSALPEVTGDAALLVDPLDEGVMASALHRLLTEPSLHRDLCQRGVQRSRRFRWSDTAEVIYQGLCEMCGVEVFQSQGALAT